jgi:hypothetical protein
MPPIHPYSSPTAFKNGSDANIESPGCQLISTRVALMHLPRKNSIAKSALRIAQLPELITFS